MRIAAESKGGVGFVWLPWLAAAGGAAITAAAVPTWRYLSNQGSLVLQTLGINDDPTITPTQPQFRAPTAPKTGYGMTHWSPEWSNEALQQQVSQSQYSDGVASGSKTPGNANPDPPKDYSGLFLLGAAVIGGLALVAAVKK